MTSTIQQVREALSAPNMATKRFFDRDFAQVCELAETLARHVDLASAQIATVTESNEVLSRFAARLGEIVMEVQE